MSGNCLVCCDTVIDNEPLRGHRVKKRDLLEEELCVYFFVKKFILKDYSHTIFQFHGVFEDFVTNDVEFETYLRTGKSLGECVKFCTSCDNYVKQAKDTYTNLVLLLAQLNKLQQTLQNKLRDSFTQDQGIIRHDNSLRGAIRRSIKEHLKDLNNAEVNWEPVKVEDQSLFLSAVVKTEPDVEDFHDDDFLANNNECNLDMSDFVISPSSSLSSDGNESLKASKSKKAKAASKRKTTKPKKWVKSKKVRQIRQKKDYVEPSPDVPGDTGCVPSTGKTGPKPEGTKRARIPLERRTCPVCGAVFARPITMKYHLNAIHEKTLMFKCDIVECGMEFYLKETYNIHVKRHLSKEQIRHLILADKFDLVQLSDGTPFNLQETMDEIEKLNSREYSQDIVDQVLNRTCPKCRKIFHTEIAMQYHLKIRHTQSSSSDSRHICEKCGKSYSLLSSYKTHVKFDHVESVVSEDNQNDPEGLPSKPRPFTCDIEGCNRSFVRPEYVRSHKKNFHRLGNSEGPFLCSFCGKALMTNPSLKRHILTHHTEDAPRKYKCHLCEKSFLTSTLLKKHLMCKSHGGQGRPWPSKWNPKYNETRKNRNQLTNSSMEYTNDSNSGIKSSLKQIGNSSEAHWFQGQSADALNPSTTSIVVTWETEYPPKDLHSPSF